MKNIIVTGGAGFIGGNFIHYLLKEQPKVHILNLDLLTYAGNLDTLKSVEKHPHYQFKQGDIGDADLVQNLLQTFKPDAIVNFAAESHVDRSIDGPAAFLQTNVMGTLNLLEQAKAYWERLTTQQKQDFRFLQVSTDEVYGSLGKTGLFTETTPYAPNSPYSASKAASDHLVRSWFHTYGFPVLTTNCSNNYGPYQFPEKLIPLFTLNALAGEKLPIYGDGSNIRDWLYVDDHCRAIFRTLEAGRVGEVYNVGGNSEKTNLEVIDTLCELLDEIKPAANGQSYKTLKYYVNDRPGHDQRYAIDASKLKNELGWEPQETFETGLRHTIQWYLDNLDWCQRVKDGSYQGQRLGLGD